MTLLILVSIPAIAQEKSPKPESGAAALEGFQVGFSGVYATGLVTTAVNAPGESAGGLVPMDFGWGAGVIVEYGTPFGLRPFFDINMYRVQKQVARAGEYSLSEWIFEQTDWSTHDVLFNQDAFYYMDTIGARIGAKFAFPVGKAVPWVGAGYGLHSWTVTYGTGDRTGMWGTDSGYVWGPTVLAGIMFSLTPDSPDPMLMSVFADLMSPVANETIEDLFFGGWTWDNLGGNHVIGPYRFGVQLIM